MARNAAATSFLEGLTRNERMPQPLGEWVRTEIECGLSTLERLALAAALEGCCGIPNAHRETKQPPEDRALWLALTALESLHHWWDKAKRAELKALVSDPAAFAPCRLLRCWCMWRATERAKRRVQEPFIHFATETIAA